MLVRFHNPVPFFTEFENLFSTLPAVKYVEKNLPVNLSLKETSDTLNVYAELPGVKKEDVKISLDKNMLTITAERKNPELKENEQWLRNGISYGKFERTVTIPLPVDSEKISATHENGILHIVLPKAEVAKVKEIVIR